MSISAGNRKVGQHSGVGPAGKFLVPVIPSVDTDIGLVIFVFQHEAHHRWCSDPRLLVSLLAKSVGPVLWNDNSANLRISVAASGHRHGKVVEIPLFMNQQVNALKPR
ncbi:hypothetical protein FDW83_02985 [Pseudarthrobacter sp. NamE2]|uniref:hypothetical protein n=1 Tax=Pseudarthrobacter sp. NamE2 TaxID=2576838 RepID=UPI0010FEF6F8|nr:hypothetical protein [Pseudarthrobacter sp. NamE2]TLM85367.1 hypothetical protein FDW83_02985 [Pseudarthrobacter sp. NamE2]